MRKLFLIKKLFFRARMFRTLNPSRTGGGNASKNVVGRQAGLPTENVSRQAGSSS